MNEIKPNIFSVLLSLNTFLIDSIEIDVMNFYVT